MGRVEGCKVASGGQLLEAGIHRWEGGHLVWMEDFGSHEQRPFVNVNVAEPYRQSLNSLESMKSNIGGEYADSLVGCLTMLLARRISDKG